MKAHVFADIKLNPTQLQFMQALEAPEVTTIGFGGAKKGGKSFIARHAMLRRRLQYPGTNALLTRRSYREVNTNHKAEIVRQCRKYKIKFRFDVKDNFFEFPEYTFEGIPSKLYLGYAETLKDAERYQGGDWMDIFHEEAAQQQGEILEAINTEQVTPVHVEGATGKIVYTWNPIGAGKRWVKDHVKRPAQRGVPGYVFIPSNWQDNIPFKRANPHFAENIRRQHAKQPWLIRALLEGDDESDPDRFFVFDEEEGGRNVQHLKPPYWATYYAGVDYGYNPSAFAVIYAAKWRDHGIKGTEHFHVVGEIKEWRLDPDEQARLAKEKEKLLGLPPRIMRYADPATGKEIEGFSDEQTRTVAMMWDSCKWFTTPAARQAKASGLTVLRKLLKSGTLTIEPDCHALIQELADAQHEKKPDGSIGSSTDPSQPDDSTDALRYMAVEVFGLAYAAEPISAWEDDYEEYAA